MQKRHLVYILIGLFVISAIPTQTNVSTSTDFVAQMPSNAFWTGALPNSTFSWANSNGYRNSVIASPLPLTWQWAPNCQISCNKYGLLMATTSSRYVLANLSSVKLLNLADRYTISGYAGSWLVNFTVWNHDIDSISVLISASGTTGWLDIGFVYQGGFHTSSYALGSAVSTSVRLIDGTSGSMQVQTSIFSATPANSFTASANALGQWSSLRRFDNSSGGTQLKTSYWGGLAFNLTQSRTIEIGVAAKASFKNVNLSTSSVSAASAILGEERTYINSILGNATPPSLSPTSMVGKYYWSLWFTACELSWDYMGNGGNHLVYTIDPRDRGEVYKTDGAQPPAILGYANLNQFVPNGVTPGRGLSSDPIDYQLISWSAYQNGSGLPANVLLQTIKGMGRMSYIGFFEAMMNNSLRQAYNSSRGAWQYTNGGAVDAYFWDGVFTFKQSCGALSAICPFFPLDINWQSTYSMRILANDFKQLGKTNKFAYWMNQYNSHLASVQDLFWDEKSGSYADRNATLLIVPSKYYPSSFRAVENELMLTMEMNATRVAMITKYLQKNLPFVSNGVSARFIYVTIGAMAIQRLLPAVYSQVKSLILNSWLGKVVSTVEDLGWSPILGYSVSGGTTTTTSTSTAVSSTVISTTTSASSTTAMTTTSTTSGVTSTAVSSTVTSTTTTFGIASISLNASPTTGPPGTTVIFTGQYLDSSGNPVAGRTLDLYHGRDASPAGNVVTDANGYYSKSLTFKAALTWVAYYQDPTTGLVSNTVTITIP